ncbi:hypothetical protein ISN44_As01g038860 [Arabidopsis suecica]|uniref:Uncharacterized protein n=1 Tax=Arabidopsis suecica TaxID=45249 RepID=A0A8T2HBB7_ARASU|nr:hypothetical protein ISN44_As01g038860 [Arabidopsis suecica]
MREISQRKSRFEQREDDDYRLLLGDYGVLISTGNDLPNLFRIYTLRPSSFLLFLGLNPQVLLTP